MSIKVMSAVLETSPTKANKLLTLIAIANNADENGWAFPGQAELARKVRVTVRAIQKLLDALEAEGEVIIYNRVDPKNPQQHYSNAYHLAKYGNPNAPPPIELRGHVRRRLTPSEQADATRGHVPADATPTNTDTLPSEQPYARVANPRPHDPSLNRSLDPSPEARDRGRATQSQHSKKIGKTHASKPTQKQEYGFAVNWNLVAGGGGSVAYEDGQIIPVPQRGEVARAAIGIFNAFLGIMREVGHAQMGRDEKLWKDHQEAALTLALARETPEAVERYVLDQYRGADVYWQQKSYPMPLSNVAKSIRSWRARQSATAPQPPNGAPHTPPAAHAARVAPNGVAYTSKGVELDDD